jgi:hypothetical protein
MLEAYFDESGTHAGAPLMCVAGYLFSSDQASKGRQEWDAVLERYGVPYFHMTDCAHGAGVFKRISKPVRAEICRTLIELIKLRAELGITVSVREADYIELMPSDVHVDPYSFCVSHCMQGVVAWASKYNYSGRVSCFFESGHKNENIANHLISWLTTITPIAAGFRYHSHSFVATMEPVGNDRCWWLATMSGSHKPGSEPAGNSSLGTSTITSE